LQGGLVAGHGGEVAGRLAEVVEGAAEPVGDRLVAVAGREGLGGGGPAFGVGELVEAVPEQAGFGAAEAAEAPLGVGEVADEDFLDGVGGLEGGEEGVEEGLALGGVFAGEHGGAGGEAVAEGVPARACLALGGAGAGGEPGVAAVGELLSFGGHGLVLLGRVLPVGRVARRRRRGAKISASTS